MRSGAYGLQRDLSASARRCTSDSACACISCSVPGVGLSRVIWSISFRNGFRRCGLTLPRRSRVDFWKLARSKHQVQPEGLPSDERLCRVLFSTLGSSSNKKDLPGWYIKDFFRVERLVSAQKPCSSFCFSGFSTNLGRFLDSFRVSFSTASAPASLLRCSASFLTLGF